MATWESPNRAASRQETPSNRRCLPACARSATTVGPAETAPDDFSLQQNYLNPFNASTRIRYTLSEEGPFSLVVYNVLDQRLRTLVMNWGTVGTHTAQWDGLRDVGQAAASGLYFYRLERGEQTQVRRMTLLR